MDAHDTSSTLHYVDPPYVAQSRDAGTDYRHEMTDDDHRTLAAKLETLKGMVIVSGYHSPLYDEIFAKWQRVERRALADGARERIEVLWLRNVTPQDDLWSGHNDKDQAQNGRA
jgi:DNA adenine methylase